MLTKKLNKDTVDRLILAYDLFSKFHGQYKFAENNLRKQVYVQKSKQEMKLKYRGCPTNKRANYNIIEY